MNQSIQWNVIGAQIFFQSFPFLSWIQITHKKTLMTGAGVGCLRKDLGPELGTSVGSLVKSRFCYNDIGCLFFWKVLSAKILNSCVHQLGVNISLCM